MNVNMIVSYDTPALQARFHADNYKSNTLCASCLEPISSWNAQDEDNLSLLLGKRAVCASAYLGVSLLGLVEAVGRVLAGFTLFCLSWFPYGDLGRASSRLYLDALVCLFTSQIAGKLFFQNVFSP